MSRFPEGVSDKLSLDYDIAEVEESVTYSDESTGSHTFVLPCDG